MYLSANERNKFCMQFVFFILFQFKKGGPIIAVQVENEYGSYAKDKNYMPFIKEVGGGFEYIYF